MRDLLKGKFFGKHRCGRQRRPRFRLALLDIGITQIPGEAPEILNPFLQRAQFGAQGLGILDLRRATHFPIQRRCILGAKRPAQVEENRKALEIVERLSDDVIQRIEEILATL